MVTYSKYGNAEVVEELRGNVSHLQHEYDQQEVMHTDIVEQNKILKQQAHMLLQQNEDFSKMVSELSRYYYRIKQGSLKLKELVNIMEVYDEQMDQKLVRLMGEEIEFSPTDMSDDSMPTQKYF